MYVNPFWFGVLVTIILEVVVLLICGFISVKRVERYEEQYEEQNDEDEQK